MELKTTTILSSDPNAFSLALDSLSQETAPHIEGVGLNSSQIAKLLSFSASKGIEMTTNICDLQN